MESLESNVVRPRQARYQAALRPGSMHVDDSTVLFGFLAVISRATLHELCKYRSHLSYCAQLSVAQTIENKEMHFAIELSRGALLARKAAALGLLRIPKPPYIP